MREYITEIGSVCSIVALLGTVAFGIWRVGRYYKRLRERAEEDLVEQLRRFENASRTQGARTDLGFFLLNRLSRYRGLAILATVTSLAVATWSFVAFVHSVDRGLPFRGSVMAISGAIGVSVLVRDAFKWMRLERRYDEQFEKRKRPGPSRTNDRAALLFRT